MNQSQAVLVTGGTGFLGAAVAGALIDEGHRVCALARRLPHAAHRIPGVEYAAASILDLDTTRGVLLDFAPDSVIHAAGLTSRGADLSELFERNVVGTDRLLSAIMATQPSTSLLLASSSSVYSRDAPLPISEAAPQRPRTPYGISKLAQELVVRARDMERVAVLRYFNLIGPSQSSDLALSGFCRRIAEAEYAGDRTIRVGRLDTQRDLVDVRDAARATTAVLEAEAFEDLNVATGIAWSMADCVDQLLDLARVPLEVVYDETLDRASDVLAQRGDPARLMELTGWRPVIPFEDTAKTLLDVWRERMSR